MGDGSRVVITGIGIISPMGIGKEIFWDTLTKGISGVKRVTIFDTSDFECKHAAEVPNFSVEEFLGNKGLRYMDRSTMLLLSSTKLALEDRSKPIGEEALENVGVVIGTAFGSVHSIGEFDRESIENPSYVNPMFFPNTVINSPASQISIKYGTKCFNTTISTGFAASIDGIGYAANCIRLGRAKSVLAGGVEEISMESYAAFYYNKLLSGSNGNGPEKCFAYDIRRNGIVLGEGAAVLLLEDLEMARKEGLNILAEVAGYGTCCDAGDVNGFNPDASGAKTAIHIALEEANLVNSDIDYICGSGNGSIEGDRMECKALTDLFGDHLKDIAVGSIKPSVGECFGASGSMQAVAAVLAIINSASPPTLYFETPEKEYASLNISASTRTSDIKNVLINSFGCNGTNSSMIIKKYIP